MSNPSAQKDTDGKHLISEVKLQPLFSKVILPPIQIVLNGKTFNHAVVSKGDKEFSFIIAFVDIEYNYQSQDMETTLQNMGRGLKLDLSHVSEVTERTELDMVISPVEWARILVEALAHKKLTTKS